MTAPKFVVVERDYTAIGAKMSALGPLVEKLGTMTKGVTFMPGPEVEVLCAATTASSPTASLPGGRPWSPTSTPARRSWRCPARRTAGSRSRGSGMEKRTGQAAGRPRPGERGQAHHLPRHPGPTGAGHHQPRVVRSEHGGRRYTAFAINVERLKPWHTLTGRQHFFLDHDWMSELGEQLPIFRPPLNMHRLFGDQGSGVGKEVTVRYLTPHSKWSIHSEYQDNLFMLSLSRGGPEIWMSAEDADQIGVKDNEWIEAYNRNGVVVARAIVSHRMPKGTVFMYHAKDRTVDVPRTETSGKRGGIHNSLTRLMIKPTHIVGGYAQLSFAFNYLGPTGNQRDEVTVIRRRSQEVEY